MKINAVDGSTRPGHWSNVHAHYTYAGTPETPYLILNFELAAAAYHPLPGRPDPLNPLAAADIPLWQQNAINDKDKFIALGSQLDRDYDQPIPGISGQTVSIFLTDALLKTAPIRLSPDDFQTLRGFVADCLAYVTNRADEWDAGAPPACRLQIPFSLSDVSASDLIELSVTLSFEAQDAPTISSPPETPAAKIDCDIEDLTFSLKNIDDFAGDFESIFFNDDWQMRIGTSVSDPKPTGKKTSAIIWAVRMGKRPNVGFYYEIQKRADHYAPLPIAETVVSATVPIGSYVTGEGLNFGDKAPMTFAGADLNVWANTAFAAIDAFLAPGAAAAVSRIGSFLSCAEPPDDYLSKIRGHKRTLAAAVARTVTPIFNSGADDEIGLIAAREKFHQSLLAHLSNAFVSTCATVLSVSAVSIDGRETGEISTGRFYGLLQKYEAPATETEAAASTVEAADRNHLLSSGKIQYFKSAGDLNGGWRLPFLFSFENAGLRNRLPLPLGYRPTHLELGAGDRPAAQNYEQSTWIRFVNGPFITPVGDIEFPVILRVVPSVPVIIAQTADSSAEAAKIDSSAAAPFELALWDYSLVFEGRLSAQDVFTASIVLNNQKPPAYPKNEAHPLFASLAQFVTVYSDLLKDFETYFEKVDTAGGRADPNAVNAKAALDAFEQIVGALAAAYEQWADSSPGEMFGEAQPSETNSFEILLKAGAGGKARLDVINKSTDSALPCAPVIEIKGYNQMPAPDKPVSAIASYNYAAQQSPPADADNPEAAETHLSYEDALGISDWTILIKRLNVFTVQNALGQIQIFRNGSPGKNEAAGINDSFKLFSPVMAGAAIVPSLNYTDFDLGAMAVSKATLENYLDAFFASLLKDAVGVPLWLKMSVSFSYRLPPSEADSLPVTLPITVLPGAKVIPQKDAPLPLVAPLAEQITDWTKSTNPQLDSSSEYSIRLEIYAEESGRQMPLVSFGNIFIKAQKLIAES